MLHPSYTEIMERINKDNEDPVVNSRYSIVMATSKRARQIIGGGTGIEYDATNKPLSIAVKELYEGDIQILPNDEEPEEILEAAEAAEEEVAEVSEEE